MQKIYYNYAAFSISFRFITIFLVKCYHTFSGLPPMVYTQGNGSITKFRI